jgi:hypothetical protein
MHLKGMVYCGQTNEGGGGEENAKHMQNQNILFSVDSRYAYAGTMMTNDDNQ